MAIERLSHIGICVADPARSLRFYRDALGFREVGRLEVAGEPAATLLEIDGVRLEALYLERDGVRLELLYFPWPGHSGRGDPRPMNALGITHLSLRVDDLPKTLEELRAAADVRVLEHTRVGSAAQRSAAIFITDPDGTRIELVQS